MIPGTEIEYRQHNLLVVSAQAQNKQDIMQHARTTRLKKNTKPCGITARAKGGDLIDGCILTPLPWSVFRISTGFKSRDIQCAKQAAVLVYTPHRGVLVLVEIVSDEGEVHLPLDELEVPRRGVTLLEDGHERVAPFGPLHRHKPGDERLHGDF